MHSARLLTAQDGTQGQNDTIGRFCYFSLRHISYYIRVRIGKEHGEFKNWQCDNHVAWYILAWALYPWKFVV